MSRPVNEFRSSSKACYNTFCEENPKIVISFEDYKKIIYTYNTNLIDYILETGESLKMPFGLSELVINKYKPRKIVRNKQGEEVIKMPINWIETKKAGKHIYLLNAHTDGWKYYWMWNYWKSRIRFSFIWKFSVSRRNSRLLSSYLKMRGSKYKDLYKEFPRKK